MRPFITSIVSCQHKLVCHDRIHWPPHRQANSHDNLKIVYCVLQRLCGKSVSCYLHKSCRGKHITNQLICTTRFEIMTKDGTFLHLVHMNMYNMMNEKQLRFPSIFMYVPKLSNHTHINLHKIPTHAQHKPLHTH